MSTSPASNVMPPLRSGEFDLTYLLVMLTAFIVGAIGMLLILDRTKR